MTNINCSKSCIYQKEGKCDYSCVSVSNFCPDSQCAYFVDSSNITSQVNCE